MPAHLGNDLCIWVQTRKFDIHVLKAEMFPDTLNCVENCVYFAAECKTLSIFRIICSILFLLEIFLLSRYHLDAMDLIAMLLLLVFLGFVDILFGNCKVTQFHMGLIKLTILTIHVNCFHAIPSVQ